MRSRIPQRRDHDCNRSAEIAVHEAGVDTHHAKSRFAKRAISPRLLPRSLRVVAAVDFDDELDRRCVKIRDVSAEQRHLPAKRDDA